MRRALADPACGTGGFLLAAHEYLTKHYELDRTQKRHLRYEALRGIELVDGVSRLCAMNLFLHGIGPDDDERAPPIRTDDALRNEPNDHADVVLTNPPFGKKSSITVVNEEGGTDKQTVTYNRPDFFPSGGLVSTTSACCRAYWERRLALHGVGCKRGRLRGIAGT